MEHIQVREGTTVSDEQLQWLVDIGNVLLPFWRPCHPTNKKTIPLHHVAPFWQLSIELLSAAGQAKLAPRPSPFSSAGSRAVGVSSMVIFVVAITCYDHEN